ncbi:MAG: hypothetical protein K9I36_16900 [Bacteroidia bacterium]|nr:hypothetical protein [Bacteroidia bacterium]
MAKTITCIFGLFTLLLLSCETNYEYWEVSKFKIDNTALEDSEEIKLLYTSRGPDYNRELKYYIHLIAISQKTGDTVNILTTADNGITRDDKDKIFNFFNQENLASKLIQMDLNNLKDIKHVDDVNKVEMKKINKVARDPKFDNIADNNYPTIIGSIGTLTMNNE